MTLIQRYGSALNLNVHLHSLVLDGVYNVSDFEEPKFQFITPPPIAEEIENLVKTIATRITLHLEKKGFLIKDHEDQYIKTDEEIEQEAFNKLQQAASIYRIAFGPRKG